MKVNKVTWKFPQKGWIKCNIDGVSRDNPGISSFAFLLRNEQGVLLYSQGATIEDTTNVEVEPIAIYQAAKNCSHA